MNSYKTLLFDADDTLFDFKFAEKQALSIMFQKLNLSSSNNAYKEYSTINLNLWKQYELGEITKEEILTTRFKQLFKKINIHTDISKAEEYFQFALSQEHQLIHGAYELCEHLSNQYTLYIVTNGISKTQDCRLRLSGLYSFFKDVFVSEDAGFPKPNQKYFDYVTKRIVNFEPENTLLIGDSLTSDIKGGNIAGIDTCWFNPHGFENKTNIIPNYIIYSLNQLFDILEVKHAD